MALPPNTAAQLVHEIFDLQRVVRRILSARFRGEEPGVAHQLVLRLVGEGESRASRLAERLGVGAPVLSRHIADLQEQGYVVRRKDPCDGRAQLVTLTQAGTDRLRLIDAQRTAVLNECLRDWSDEDADSTATTLQNLTKSLNICAQVKSLE